MPGRERPPEVKGVGRAAGRPVPMLLFGRRAAALVGLSWRCERPLELDWLAPQVHPHASQWPGDVLQAVEVIRQRLRRIATQRGIDWSEARAVIWGGWRDVTHIDDSWCRWRLETHTPFARLDSWINQAELTRSIRICSRVIHFINALSLFGNYLIFGHGFARINTDLTACNPRLSAQIRVQILKLIAASRRNWTTKPLLIDFLLGSWRRERLGGKVITPRLAVFVI